MTSETDLQALSRAAAAGLPPEVAKDIGPWAYAPQRVGDYPDGELWLYESTEACAEIMVRVLWASDVDITGGMTTKGIWGAGWSGIKEGQFVYESDPMLAFRVAVLRAVCALSGK